MSEPRETHLGDGLYASFDGHMLSLRAPREAGDHWVGLEPETMKAFLVYLRELATEHPELLALWRLDKAP